MIYSYDDDGLFFFFFFFFSSSLAFGVVEMKKREEEANKKIKRGFLVFLTHKNTHFLCVCFERRALFFPLAARYIYTYILYTHTQ